MAVSIGDTTNLNKIKFKEQGSNPATPDAGFGYLFAKADGVYFKDDAGSVVGPFGAPTGDADAIHDNVAGEIAAITAKTTPVDADVLLIEDSAAANAKKKVSWANLKATLTTYYDSRYATAGHSHVGITKYVGTALIGGDDTGDARGSYAVDIQASRTAADRVASGNYAVAFGRNAKASGNNSIAIGGTNAQPPTASGQGSIAIGEDANSIAGQTIAIGYSTDADLQYGVAIGDSAHAAYGADVALGQGAETAAAGEAVISGTVLKLQYQQYRGGAKKTVALLEGVSGGQTLIGGTAASENLTLKSTSHATKGKVVFGNAGTSAYNEVNDRFGFGTNAPGQRVHVVGNIRMDASDAVGMRFYDANTVGIGGAFGLYTSAGVEKWRVGLRPAMGGGLTDDLYFNRNNGATYLNVFAIGNSGNIGVNTVQSWGTSAVGTLAIKNGTAPSAAVVDQFHMYAKDWAAGKSAPWFKGEDNVERAVLGVSATQGVAAGTGTVKMNGATARNSVGWLTLHDHAGNTVYVPYWTTVTG